MTLTFLAIRRGDTRSYTSLRDAIVGDAMRKVYCTVRTTLQYSFNLAQPPKLTPVHSHVESVNLAIEACAQTAIRSQPSFGKGKNPVRKDDGQSHDDISPRHDHGPCVPYISFRNSARLSVIQ